ncbi:MAG TPA: T9SS type A sorting domain-containing protein [Bacteroidia bacterium]|nr:T9SS type A sorting domain-containing protein [Bacteroidia bacterium]
MNYKGIKFYLVVLFICSCSGLLFAQNYIITNVAGQRYHINPDGGNMATNTHLANPTAVYADNTGNIYISDWGNNKLRVVNSNGVISTLAGIGVNGYSGDGGPSTAAELCGPMGIFADASHNVYMADIGNGRIRKIDTSGIISSIAGNGAYGFSGDGGSALNAEFEDPAGICGDKSGNIYVADEFNNRVRKISKSGIISTVAGSASRGYSGDGGPATGAELYYPSSVAVDDSNNIFIADESNNAIRKVNSSGIIFTIAGNGIGGFTGDGGPSNTAELFNAAGVGVDNSGNIYITDGFNERTRKITPDGKISTIAGTGLAGYSASFDVAIHATLYDPVCIMADTSGNLYFANIFNNLVQKLSVAPTNEYTPPLFKIYPNPNLGIFTVDIENNTPDLTLEVYNILGQHVSTKSLIAGETQIDLRGSPKGIYLYRIIATDDKLYGTGKIVIF